jgi:hypothetical protein
MTFDEYGTVWLTDPWIAAAAIVGILATVLWSHGWIASGAPPRPRTMAVQLRQDSARGVALLNQAVNVARPTLLRRQQRRTAAPIVHLGHRHRARTAA